jgi:hypothetical protein
MSRILRVLSSLFPWRKPKVSAAYSVCSIRRRPARPRTVCARPFALGPQIAITPQ